MILTFTVRVEADSEDWVPYLKSLLVKRVNYYTTFKSVEWNRELTKYEDEMAEKLEKDFDERGLLTL